MDQNLTQFQSFRKGTAAEKVAIKPTESIIYTRVSGKSQVDNMSLDVQLKFCNAYAESRKYMVSAYFGGTYESASTDERKEFQRMITYVKKRNKAVSNLVIVVASLERFSRNENAIWLSGQLRKLGINIESATQPIDTSNPSGVFQQNLLFLFGQYDNELRKQKCMAGMKEKISRGQWLTALPRGYSYDRSQKGVYKVIINEDGHYIRKAFEMKVRDGLSNTEIVNRLAKMGFKISKQRITNLFRNPFYCGLIAHNMLDGKIIVGEHEPIISNEMFLAANGIINKLPHGYRQARESNDVPLRKFIKCSVCNVTMTGYMVKKKELWYYKCNTIGCKCNKSASKLHKKFNDLLSRYRVTEPHTRKLQEYLLQLYYSAIEHSGDEVKALRTKITTLESKLEVLQERLAFGDINRQMFDKFSSKVTDDLASAQDELGTVEKKLSNPEETIEKTVKMTSKLYVLWNSWGYYDKKKLQELVFPKGLIYDREIDDYRTIEVNNVFEEIACYSGGSDKNESGQTKNFSDLSALVPRMVRKPNQIDRRFEAFI